ncbi:IQCA1, partial [Cordylochernes scorpioides]
MWESLEMRRRTDWQRKEQLDILMRGTACSTLMTANSVKHVTPPPPEDPASSPQARADQVAEGRRQLQARHEAEYQAALVAVKERLLQDEGPEYRDQLKDEIRGWYRQYLEVVAIITGVTLMREVGSTSPPLNVYMCSEETGEFPEFPSEEEGGSQDQSFLARMTSNITADTISVQ